tara:strand:- start:43 stop:399 length:357 start_codon:yes stop_codon:yes gene_type:complete
MNMNAQERWEDEQKIAFDYQKINNKELKHEVFINFVDLKRSFIDEAKDMVEWINLELKRKRPELEDHVYFIDRGFYPNKPSHYKYRSKVFKDLKDQIMKKEKPNVYEIVEKWDMWYHS